MPWRTAHPTNRDRWWCCCTLPVPWRHSQIPPGACRRGLPRWLSTSGYGRRRNTAQSSPHRELVGDVVGVLDPCGRLWWATTGVPVAWTFRLAAPRPMRRISVCLPVARDRLPGSPSASAVPATTTQLVSPKVRRQDHCQDGIITEIEEDLRLATYTVSVRDDGGDQARRRGQADPSPWTRSIRALTAVGWPKARPADAPAHLSTVGLVHRCRSRFLHRRTLERSARRAAGASTTTS